MAKGYKFIANMQKLIPILLIGWAILVPAGGQTVPEGLTAAIAGGKADGMAEYFHQSLEMTILGKDYMASKNQATRIMENFFKEHPPTDFRISFEGAKEESKYAIGSLATEGGAFRVNLFFLNMEDKRLIYYLSIEKESEYELQP
jgi:hypothetical protein